MTHVPSRLLVLAALLVAPLAVAPAAWAQGTAPPDSDNDGVFEVSTTDHLVYLSQNGNADFKADYEQTADISFPADETTFDWDGDGTVDGNGTSGWFPIGDFGNQFEGTYDGGGHTISNLYIDRTANRQGLFGDFQGVVKNLGVVDCDITTTSSSVGAVVGMIDDSFGSGGELLNVYATGSVTGDSFVGGLAGPTTQNTSTEIRNSYSRVDATCTGFNCEVGGLISQNGGLIENSYSTGAVANNGSGTEGATGGLVAVNEVGDGTGDDAGTVTNSFWDTETSGQTTSDGGTGKTTTEMKTQSTFTGAGWDFAGETANGTADHWGMDANTNNGYPHLTVLTGPSRPTTAATNVTFSNVTATSVDLNWTNGDGAARVVFMKAASTGSASPSDNTTYAADATFGNGDEIGTTGWYAVYNNTGSSVSVSGLSACTAYRVHVVEYNGGAGAELYLSTTATGNPGQTNANDFSGGDGSGKSPYQIASSSDLITLSQQSACWGDAFQQTADITFNADETAVDWDGDGSPDGNNPTGFTPIGSDNTPFTGSYSGGQNTVTNLYIDEDVLLKGLFGEVNGGTVELLGIDAADITGKGAVGAAVGRAEGGATVQFVHVTGHVRGSGTGIGGIVGVLNTPIGTTLKDSYSRAAVTGTGNSHSDIGGAAGFHFGTIKRVYAAGPVSGRQGTFVNVGGLVGNSGTSVTEDAFWDKTATGQASSDGGTGKTTAEMQSLATYTHTGTAGLSTAWDFVNDPNDDAANTDIWDADQDGTGNAGYPMLSFEDAADTDTDRRAFTTITGTDGTGNDAGWRMFSFPKDITLGDIEDDFNFNFQDISTGHVAYLWDAANQQWDPLETDRDAIPKGQGVAVYFFDDSDDPITPTGKIISADKIGNAGTDVTMSGFGQKRFVFFGNPYLSAYDLSDVSMTVGNNFQQTVQIWDPDAGAFTTKDRSQSETVAAMQGFFVERTNPGTGPTTLTFSKSGVQNGPGSFIGTKSEAPALASADVELRLVVESEGDTLAQNRATVLFHEGAAPGWDAYDATQLAPPGNGAHATLTSPIERLGSLTRRRVAAEPFPEGTPAEVPLSVRSVGTEGSTDGSTDGSTEGSAEGGIAGGVAGTAHIELIGAPDASGPIELIDAETGATVDLRAEGYSFPLAAGAEASTGSIESPSEARFTLRAGAGALPVELTRLTATPDAGGVLLEWTTAAETQNAGFEIERQSVEEENASSDATSGDASGDATGSDWTTVGFVEGAGTTTEAQAYRFRAEGLPVGTHRFRLRQLDADGTATLSAPVAATVRLAEAYRVTAPAPNPATSGATMRLAVREAQPVRVAVYDVLGREVRVVFDGPMSAQQPTTLRIGEGLPAGQYFVRAVGERFSATERLTVVR